MSFTIISSCIAFMQLLIFSCHKLANEVEKEVRRAVATKALLRVQFLLTLYRPLPPPFLLSKAKASCSSPLPPKKSAKIAL